MWRETCDLCGADVTHPPYWEITIHEHEDLWAVRVCESCWGQHVAGQPYTALPQMAAWPGCHAVAEHVVAVRHGRVSDHSTSTSSNPTIVEWEDHG